MRHMWVNLTPYRPRFAVARAYTLELIDPRLHLTIDHLYHEKAVCDVKRVARPARRVIDFHSCLIEVLNEVLSARTLLERFLQ